MTFATEALKVSSERFVLVRISPKRLLTGATDIGASDYVFDLPSYVNADSVTVLGEAATITGRTDTTITISSADDLTDEANYTVITHSIYLTSEKHRITDGISGVPDAEWEPRLLQQPEFSQSVRDLTEGTFSLASSDIVFASTDRLGQVFCGENDSFSNAACTVWSCINDVETNNLVFDGVVTSVSIEGATFKLAVIDSFNKLNATATFGTKAQAFLFSGGGEYPLPEDENMPNPVILGRNSPTTIVDGWRHLDAYGTMNAKCYHLRGGLKAHKILPDNQTNTATVTFKCGRILADDIKKINFVGGVASSALHTFYKQTTGIDGEALYIGERILYLAVNNPPECEIGDYIPNISCATFSISSQEGWVCAVAHTGFVYSAYNVAIQLSTFGFDTFGGGPTAPSDSFVTGGAAPTFTNSVYPSMSLWVEGGDSVSNTAYYEPLALVPFANDRVHGTRYLPFDYYLGSVYVVGGENFHDVFAEVNPVAAGLTSEKANNSLWSKSVRFRYTTTAETHNKPKAFNTLKMMLTAAGMTANAASFAAAVSDDATMNSLTVPFKNDTYPTYLELIQRLCSSLFCILRVNNDREVEVVRIENTSALTADHTRDITDIVDASISGSIDYQDIYGIVNFANEEIQDFNEILGTDTTEYIETPSVIALHGISKLKKINHCLQSIADQAPRIAGYLSTPSVEYTLSTASKDLPTNIGDIVEITNAVVFGESQTIKAMVVSKSSSSAMTTLKLKEIRGVP